MIQKIVQHRYFKYLIQNSLPNFYYFAFYYYYKIKYQKKLKITSLAFVKPIKSVCFLGNCYNTFYTLSEGLNKIGWTAISINPDPPSPFVQNFHKSVKLDSALDSIRLYFDVAYNYKFLHVYNRTHDFLYTGNNLFLRKKLNLSSLKKFGVYTIFTGSGCLDGSSSEEINKLTVGLCDKCVWQNNFCDDQRNLPRTAWIYDHFDLFSNEVDLPKAISKSHKGLNIPLSPLDSTKYHPELKVPEEFKINKQSNLIVFTAFGNQHLRVNNDRDIKGVKYILEAVNRLIAEGLPIVHFHANNIPAINMKYYQVQADIIIDQLNYGTIGSAAREGMMLGKPVICYVSALMRESNIAMRDCPAVSATEESIYNVLKNIISMSQQERIEIGQSSREWMLKWFDSKVCAKRYDKITERLLNKLPLQPEEQFI